MLAEMYYIALTELHYIRKIMLCKWKYFTLMELYYIDGIALHSLVYIISEN